MNCVEPWFQVDGAAIVRTGMPCVRTWSRSSEALGFLLVHESGWDHKLADLEPVQQIRECVVMILVGVRSRGVPARSRGVRASLDPGEVIRWLTMTVRGLAQV